MSTSFAMGRYVPYDTIIHRLDPRTKILTLVLFMIAIFMGQATYVMSFLVSGVILVMALALYIHSRMKIKTLLKSIMTMWFMILFLLIVYVFTPRDASTSHLAFSLWGIDVYWEAFLDTARIVLRLVLMVMFSLMLASTWVARPKNWPSKSKVWMDWLISTPPPSVCRLPRQPLSV